MTEVGTQLEKLGAHVLCVKTDVSDEESVNRMVSVAVEKFGRIDYVSNCAGVMDARKFSDAKPSDVSGRGIGSGDGLFAVKEGTPHLASARRMTVCWL